MEHALLLTVEFDGSAFSGWQRQPERRTVQQVLEEALERLAGGPRTAIAAGRTDADYQQRIFTSRRRTEYETSLT